MRRPSLPVLLLLSLCGLLAGFGLADVAPVAAFWLVLVSAFGWLPIACR